MTVRGSFLCLGVDATRYCLKLFRRDYRSRERHWTAFGTTHLNRFAFWCYVLREVFHCREAKRVRLRYTCIMKAPTQPDIEFLPIIPIDDDTRSMRTMDAVYLRRIDPSRNMRRFYRLDIQPDLFGGFLLISGTHRRGRADHGRALRRRGYRDLSHNFCSGV
jgi:hypothetical protein